jgi:hypothetical protein
MSKKIKVLVVPSDRTGVGYFRSTKPHIALEQNYPNEFHVDIDYEPKLNDDNWLKQYDIIHYHRTLGPYDRCNEFVEKANKLGIITIMDIDDHWSPGQHHPAYLMIKNSEMDKKILNNIKGATNITTTTPIFADEIKRFNNNSIHVLPNAIDPNEKQYIPNPESSDRLRIGWLGGSSHLKDLEILEGMVGKLKSDGLLDKVQFVVCGFDLRGSITMIDENGKQTQRPIRPKESVWYKYEQIFTSNYSTVSEEYKDFLLSFKKGEYEDIANEPYRRVWTKPISTYATNYNFFDVSLAPIVEHNFNRVKSQLKVIEAGFHKKAIIAQDYGPYQIDLENYYEKPKKGQQIPDTNPNGNALLVRTSKNHKDWYRNVKKLILNPNMVEDLSIKLHNTVKDTYSINAVTSKRRDLYLKLLKEVKKLEIVA